jgi:hypothetical protein
VTAYGLRATLRKWSTARLPCRTELYVASRMWRVAVAWFVLSFRQPCSCLQRILPLLPWRQFCCYSNTSPPAPSPSINRNVSATLHRDGVSENAAHFRAYGCASMLPYVASEILIFSHAALQMLHSLVILDTHLSCFHHIDTINHENLLHCF